MMFTNVLTAIDLGGPSASFVLRKAQSYVAVGGTLHVAHVIEPQYVQYSFDPTFTGALTRSLEEDAISKASGRLAQICAEFSVPEENQHVALGRAADKIHELAERLDVDIIVVGSHAQQGWRRLLGSTANAVLHGAPVDVIVARLPENLE